MRYCDCNLCMRERDVLKYNIPDSGIKGEGMIDPDAWTPNPAETREKALTYAIQIKSSGLSAHPLEVVVQMVDRWLSKGTL